MSAGLALSLSRRLSRTSSRDASALRHQNVCCSLLPEWMTMVSRPSLEIRANSSGSLGPSRRQRVCIWRLPGKPGSPKQRPRCPWSDATFNKVEQSTCLWRQQATQSVDEVWQVLSRCLPESFGRHAEVLVHDDVSHGAHLRPRQVRIGRNHVVGHVAGGFADDTEAEGDSVHSLVV